ncbi:MAG: discoidin domain-containing protein, partial [Armatimonadota bacterium]
MRRHVAVSGLIVLAGAVVLGWAASDGPTAEYVDDWQRQLQLDWLTQDEVRGMAPQRGPVSTQEDALGACDGVKNGQWGFHTNQEDQPWWHVDLGEPHDLARVLVFNRADRGVAARASRLMLLVSTDGKAWTEVYRHNGQAFYGATDGKPLSVDLAGTRARFVRVQLPSKEFLHLDEVEVYAVGDDETNLALGKAADQSSVSRWSVKHVIGDGGPPEYFIDQALERGRLLAADLRIAGVDVQRFERSLARLDGQARAASSESSPQTRRKLYLEVRRTVRDLALSNPLLDFDRILFVKRVPTSYSHMSDQYYGWWSRPGGGIYVLEGFKSGDPRVRCLTEHMPAGNFLRPDLSYDGTKLLFAYCRHYPEVSAVKNKVDKQSLPEDAFYHVFEMNVDGTGLRQLTRGRYDDFDARYLPSGDIVFLSTRRGQFVRCDAQSAAATLAATLPDSYVRCGGDNYRPVAVYTLHVMDPEGTSIRAISPFENFEWTPSVGADGRVLYARWDYVDRDNMPFMSLWSTTPDGRAPRIVYGNFTRQPHCVFEARAIPGSGKLVFTASGHHSITAGSLMLLDPGLGSEGSRPVTRLTPEVCFPEVEGWPNSYYVNPYPLSERYYLTAWSNQPLSRQGTKNPPNALGLYLYDAFGNLELLYRAPDISSMYPMPVRPRQRPPVLPGLLSRDDRKAGRFVLVDVYRGVTGIEPGSVTALRIVGVPPKT